MKSTCEISTEMQMIGINDIMNTETDGLAAQELSACVHVCVCAVQAKCARYVNVRLMLMHMQCCGGRTTVQVELCCGGRQSRCLRRYGYGYCISCIRIPGEYDFVRANAFAIIIVCVLCGFSCVDIGYVEFYFRRCVTHAVRHG